MSSHVFLGPMLMATGVAGVSCLVVATWLVRKMTSVARSRDDLWDEITDLLRARQTLAPRLAAIASLYLPWDEPLIHDVTVSRRRAMAARGVTEQAQAEAELSWALARLILVAERHEKLVRHADFSAVVERIDTIEAKVARLRCEYNHVAALLANQIDRTLAGVAARLRGIQITGPFDLDPMLARQAMLTSLRAGPVRPPASASRT